MLFSVLYKYIYYSFKHSDWFCQVTVRTHSLLQWEGNASSRWGAAPSVQNNRHSPRPVPIPVAALGTSQRSEELYKCCHHRGALREMPAWMSWDLSPLPTLHYWIHWEALGPAAARNTAGATGKPQSHELQDAESRDRAPVDSRRNTNDLRSKFDKNFIPFCFHKMMQLGAECELRGIEHNTAMNPQVPSHPANTIHMTFALSEVWL